MVARGVLKSKIDYSRHNAFFGVGFGSLGVPIDILPIYQLSCFIPDFSLLLVDEFLKLNGLKERIIEYTKNRFLDTIDNLSKVYGNTPYIILCSDFMHLGEYLEMFRIIKTSVENSNDLTNLVLETLPENKKHIESARDYPIHEFACVKYLSNKNYSLKIGPSKEKIYDKNMQILGFDIDFAYILDAYALGTKSADKVVHYVPDSRGSNNGQRIFFEEDEYKIKAKLQQGCDEALRYFCKIASVSGYLLNQRYLNSEEISEMYGRKLKRETTRLVLENIISPYKEVSK